MLQEGHAIPTSEPDPFDGGCPADTEHSPAVRMRHDDVLKVMEENVKLKKAIREANTSIKRMMNEIDAMVAKLLAA
jgi:hypothetical protein